MHKTSSSVIVRLYVAHSDLFDVLLDRRVLMLPGENVTEAAVSIRLAVIFDAVLYDYLILLIVNKESGFPNWI